jgi:hypothetical protein
MGFPLSLEVVEDQAVDDPLEKEQGRHGHDR